MRKITIEHNGEVYVREMHSGLLPEYIGMIAEQGEFTRPNDGRVVMQYKAYTPGPHGATGTHETLGYALDWLMLHAGYHVGPREARNA